MSGQQISDERLMLDVAGGGREALSRLMKRHASSLLTFLVRMTGDHHVAEELFQDVFVAVWSQRVRYQTENRFRPWLFGIAVNKCRARLRKVGRRPETRAVPATEVSLQASDSGPADTAVMVEQAAAVQQAVNQLSDMKQSVVVMRIWNGFAFAEIAEALNITEATARSHMCLGLNSLRKYLEPRLRRGDDS